MSRAVRIALVLTAALGLFFAIVQRIPLDAGAIDLRQYDLVEYWAAAKLLIAGKNPYNADLLLSVQRAVRPLVDPVIMWNPPWVLPLLLPLSLFSLDGAWLFWPALSLAVAGTAFSLTASRTPLSSRQGLYWAACAVTFVPLHLTLYFGQLSMWLLVGWAGFLACLRAGGAARGVAAGAILATTLFKPHLLYLVYLYLAFGVVRSDSRKMAAGIALVIAALSLAAIAIQPRVFAWYFDAVPRMAPPLYWQTPTIGSWLQLFIGKPLMWIRLLPSAITAAVLAPWMAGRRGALDPETLLILVPLSLLTSPYGWHYDHALLLPGCFFVVTAGILRYESFGDARGLGLAIAPLGVNLIDVLPVFPHAQEYSIWFPAAHLLLVLSARRLNRMGDVRDPSFSR